MMKRLVLIQFCLLMGCQQSSPAGLIASRPTNSFLHLTISGEGYFELRDREQRSYYTRSGDFVLDDMTQLIQPEGYLLFPPVSVPRPAREVKLGEEGSLLVLTPHSEYFWIVGILVLSRMKDPSKLKDVGGGRYLNEGGKANVIEGHPGWPGFGTVSVATHSIVPYTPL